MKPRIIYLILFLALFLTASTKSFVVDHLHLLTDKTQTIINDTNNFYQKRTQRPKIIIETVNRIDNLKPNHLKDSSHSVYIVFGRKNNKTNVQIYRTKDMSNIINQKFIYNLISSQANTLKSADKQKVNASLQLLIKACITKINQKFSYDNAQYELTHEQMTKLQHPNSMNMGWAIVIALVVGAVLWYFRKQKTFR